MLCKVGYGKRWGIPHRLSMASTINSKAIMIKNSGYMTHFKGNVNISPIILLKSILILNPFIYSIDVIKFPQVYISRRRQ